jgi:hypothetical protein
MSAAEQSPAGQGETDRLAKHLRLLQEINLPPSVCVRQLLIAGFPAVLIHPHFPDLPASAFAAPPAPTPRRRHRVTDSGPIAPPEAGQGGGPVLAPAAALLPAIGERLMRARLPAPDPAIPVSAPRAPIEGISFQYVPLIQCSFPHTDPGAITHFTRRNGWLELTLSTARPDTGLPYGVPARLLTMYCASEAVRTRSPEIFLGSTVHDFLRRMDVPITRGERGSLRAYANQLLRLVHCAVSIDENVRDASGRTGLHIRQALFVEEARLWWDEAEAVGQGSSLILSSVLFDSILERSAPLSTAAIRQLRKSPMDLDVYAWLAHRLFQLSRPSTISWSQLSGQFGHDYGELRYFRRFFGDSLQRVLKVYPEAKFKWSNTGITLLPSRPHIEHRPTLKA